MSSMMTTGSFTDKRAAARPVAAARASSSSSSFLALVLLLSVITTPPSVSSHSWVVKVGLEGGRSRGGVTGSDTILQRYFCPLPLLDDCQPDPKHDIILTPDALRPCRANVESPSPRASVEAGDDLFVSWMGNGHVDNGQSDDTCVQFLLAPYESDPNLDDFTAIPGGECVDYWYRNSEGFLKTDTTITVPVDTPPGKYTMLWYWGFTEFWYASCSDIDVLPANGAPPAPTPAPNNAPVTPAPSAPQTTVAPPTITPPDEAAMETYLNHGCANLAPFPDGPSAFCKSYLGSTSYCKYYQTDSCGRSVCQGGDFLLDCSGITTTTTTTAGASSSTTSSTTTTTGGGGTSSSPLDAYLAGGCTSSALSLTFCGDEFGSYCKSSGKDSCGSGRAVCHGESHSDLDPCPPATVSTTTTTTTAAASTTATTTTTTTASTSTMTPTTTTSTTASTTTTTTIGGASPMDAYLAGGCTAPGVPDTFCGDTFGNSYCKSWQADGCGSGRSVCKGESHSDLDPCP